VKTRLAPIGTAAPVLAGENRSAIAALESELEKKRAVVRRGWGPDKVHKKNKLTTWERIERLVDPGAPILSVGTLVNWGRAFEGSKQQAPGAGVHTVFARIADRWVVVIANDNTVASGAWWPLTPEKIQRAQTMALRLRVPVVYLVDCSGLFLPEQAHSFPGRTGAGHIFQMNSLLSAAGVPQIAGVFGDCIAGGGYMPIISDRVYMTEQAYMVIAGAALIKGAKSQKLTSLDIGGPEVHVHQSACADVRVPDDVECVRQLRAEVCRLPTSGADFYRHGVEAEGPLFDPAMLDGILPKSHREVYDIKEIVGRLVDGSLFHEFLPGTGPEVLTGLARVGGLWMGFAANVQEAQPHPEGKGPRPGGILYRDGIAKLAAFSRACNDDGIPLVWLQDIAGFDIGVEAEAQGLLGYGSSLIYTNSTNTTPMFTVLLRKASGAGYYAMAGLPYDPVVQLSTVISRLAVMEGRTLAVAAYRTKLDDDFEIASTDPVERAAIEKGMDETAERIERDMDPIASAARMDTDEVVRLGELRTWLQALAEMCYQAPGTRRIKNPRIWSIHDLEVLHAGRRAAPAPVERTEKRALTPPPEPGLKPLASPMEGTLWHRAAPTKPAFVEIGAAVSAGETLALVEVMKTFTPVRADAAGTLVAWARQDGEAVAAGDVIAWLRP
jgi:acetyl-CoA carboxylase carboxyltransferase component/biotin carboxyl carrier protein